MKNITLSLLIGLVFLGAGCDNADNNKDKNGHDEHQNDTGMDRGDAKDANEDMAKENDMKRDADFLVEAYESGMAEIKLGELAQKSGTLQVVKDLGKMMAEDHTKANAEIMAVAKTKNITLPTALSDARQRDYDDLADEKGEDFDKKYTDKMTDDHEKAVEKFEDEADKGNDADIKSWASGMVPKLKHHLEKCKNAEDMVKNHKYPTKK